MLKTSFIKVGALTTKKKNSHMRTLSHITSSGQLIDFDFGINSLYYWWKIISIENYETHLSKQVIQNLYGHKYIIITLLYLLSKLLLINNLNNKN